MLLANEVHGWFSNCFTEPLWDLGSVEAEQFRGVLSPKSEVGQLRSGVNAVFLENAEDYYKKYQGFDYWRKLLLEAMNRSGVAEPELIIEYGCGFGNATLPMLDIVSTCKIVASDISPNLLAILERLLIERNLKDRCVSVAMDALKPYVKEGCADLVFGAAILHHLVEPGQFVKHAMRVLKPGGVAFFFEPLEGGHAVLLSICDEIKREAKRRTPFKRLDRLKQWKYLKRWRPGRPWDHAIYLTGLLSDALRPQIFRMAIPGWKDMDDKWAFPRAVIDEMARDAGATATVYGLHDNVGQFRRHFAYMLETYGGMSPTDYPDWAWEIFDRYDRETFSPDMLRDLALEGCIVFRKNSTG
jgi:ubiquinone/menaquinone biosynthesis C-methylase UbiE